MEQGYTCMNGTQQGSQVFLSTSASGNPSATYTNQEPSDGYLTPASPERDQPPQLPAFPASFSRSQSQPHGIPQKHVPFPRADSGIESDAPRSPTSASPTGTTNLQGSTLYEYIDPKDVHVEPGRHQINTTHGENSSSGISMATTAGYAGDVISDSEDGINLNDGTRRRINPMYEALENSATRLYAQTCHCKMQSSTQQQLWYLRCACIVLFIIIIFLLAVMAYMFFGLIPGLQNDVQNHAAKMQKIESDFKSANGEANALQQLLEANKSSSDTFVSAILGNTIIHLNDSVWTLRSQLYEMNMDLQQQITNISLTPGPQGPPGVGNLSSCFYTNSSSYQALPGPYSTTSWQPSMETLQDNIVMSAGCGVIGGTEQFVESRAMSPNVVQFRCRCDGSVDGYGRRACQIHLIMCPRF